MTRKKKTGKVISQWRTCTRCVFAEMGQHSRDVISARKGDHQGCDRNSERHELILSSIIYFCNVVMLKNSCDWLLLFFPI